MALQLTSKNTLLLKVGGTPDATNIITTQNDVFVSPKASMIESKDIGNGQGGNAKIETNEDDVVAEFSVDMTARTSGSGGTAPACADLLKCCGLKETVDSDNKLVAYTPELLQQTAQAKAYVDGAMRNITGTVGDLTISGEVGQIVKFSYSLKGYTALSETAEANPDVTLDSNIQLTIKSANVVTVGGNNIVLKSFEFALGNDIKKVYATNRKEYYIGDFKPTIKVTALKANGNGAHWDELKGSTQKEVIVTLGGSDNNTIELKVPFAQPQDVSESDDSGQVKYDRTWLCQSSAGGDNFTLTYK